MGTLVTGSGPDLRGDHRGRRRRHPPPPPARRRRQLLGGPRPRPGSRGPERPCHHGPMARGPAHRLRVVVGHRHLARDAHLPLLHDHRPSDRPAGAGGPSGLRRRGGGRGRRVRRAPADRVRHQGGHPGRAGGDVRRPAPPGAVSAGPRLERGPLVRGAGWVGASTTAGGRGGRRHWPPRRHPDPRRRAFAGPSARLRAPRRTAGGRHRAGPRGRHRRFRGRCRPRLRAVRDRPPGPRPGRGPRDRRRKPCAPATRRWRPRPP